jgi:AraC-like DNA-binding protein
MLEGTQYLRDHSKVAADPLSDIVTLAGARCSIWNRLLAGSPWALRFPPPRKIKFMAVIRGSCWLSFDAEATPRRISAGDVLMLSGPRPYRLGSDLEAPSLDAAEVFSDPTAKLVRVGEGDDFFVIGGHVVLDSERGWMLESVLPPVVHIDSSLSEAPTLRFFLGQLVKEVGSDKAGAELMSEQLAQLVFVQVLRSYLSTSALLLPGWLKVLRDERIAPALRLMHQEPGRTWRLKELAKIVAMSRTSFAVRFRQAAGMAPLDYLAHWRMCLAEQRLRETSTPIATLARSLGYTSESAFSNAFKRARGLAPARYRSRAS